MSREALGEFEHQVLLTVLRLGGEGYSVPIVLEIENRTGREVAQPAVYIALRRLEKKGLLRSRLDDHAGRRTGRVRRYFRLTARGKRRLVASRRAFERLWEGFGDALDEV